MSPVAGSWLDVWPTSVLVGKQAAVVQETAAARGRETLSRANCRSYSSGQEILALLILQSFLPEKIGSNDSRAKRLRVRHSILIALRKERSDQACFVIGAVYCVLPPAFCDCADAAASQAASLTGNCVKSSVATIEAVRWEEKIPDFTAILAIVSV